MSDRKRRPWAVVLAVVILLPVFYFGSLIPLAWAIHHYPIDTPGSAVAQMLNYYCLPFRWCFDYGPAWVQSALQRYEDFLDSL